MKYTCIRCLKDDLLNDGKVVQIDQCLSCSRYEPVIGQTYDLVNEVGANFSSILDDMQAGMMNMQDYLDFVRIERMHKQKEDFQMNYKTVRTRNINETDFDDVWDEGVRMDWKYTPVEQQKAQVNWRQDINSADKSPEKLDSCQSSNGPGASGNTPGITLIGGNYKDYISRHKQYMDDVLAGKYDKSTAKTSARKAVRKAPAAGEQQEDPYLTKCKAAIQEGFNNAEKAAANAVENLKTVGYEQELQNQCSTAKIDPVMAMTIAACESDGNPEGSKGIFGLAGEDIKGQITAGVRKIQDLVSKYNQEGNPIGPVTAFKGWKESLENLNTKDTMFSPDWVKAIDGVSEPLSYFPEAIAVYQKIEAANTGLSQLKDTSDYVSPEFPFTTAKLNEVYFVQDYGVTNVDSGVAAISNAVVFTCPEGSELHAPEAGSVSDFRHDEKIGNYLEVIGDSGNTYILGGMNSPVDESVYKKGEKTSKAVVIGVTNEQLILQVKQNGKYVDPKTVWRLLQQLKPTREKTVGQQIADNNNATK